MDKQITITQYSSDSEEDLDTYSAREVNQGVDKVEVYWWGVRVWISGPTLRTIGAGVSIGGIWIPEPLISKVVATLGVLIATSSGGIVFNSSPHLAIPGTPLHKLNFWGVSFQ